MLLFANYACNSFPLEVRKGFCGMFQQSRSARRLRRRHRGRQVNQPFRVGRKPAHHLQSSQGILFSDRYVVMEACRDNPFPNHVVDVQEVIMELLGCQLGCLCYGRDYWPHGLRVSRSSTNGDELFFRISQRRQASAEHAPCIYVDCAVQPLRLRLKNDDAA